MASDHALTCARHWRGIVTPEDLSDMRAALIVWVASQSPERECVAWFGPPPAPGNRAWEAARWAADANTGLTELAVSRDWEKV